MWCVAVSFGAVRCHVLWPRVMWCGVLWCAVLPCGLLQCVIGLVCCTVWGGSVLWSHDVRCGVLCFHVVWLVWFVEWCVGCLARWIVWPLGLFCWVFSWLGHVVWCLHPVVCAAVCCCMLCDVMCVGTHVISAIPREGGGGYAVTILVLAAF